MAASPEEQLAQATRENEELKRALQEANAKAEAAQATASEMEHLIYAVSHDFRTPLRSMSSYAQLLERQYALSEEAREMTGFIVKGVNDLRLLVEDTLKYSRIKPAPERRNLPLTPIVQWAVLNLRNAIQEAGAKVEFGELPEAFINESQFVQLFEQLIGNALKFRTENPPVIAITAEESAEGQLISVRDNGIGIEAKYHETVFAPFKRLQGREVPGTGLGLAICRKIVRAHGGRIWVESDGSNGSTFRFTIPPH